ncbi:unnamed protein product [Rotaria sp. Silwood2]|nr:unnamed protein product [Rotaria sp. Silwood2]
MTSWRRLMNDNFNLLNSSSEYYSNGQDKESTLVEVCVTVATLAIVEEDNKREKEDGKGKIRSAKLYLWRSYESHR